jgi:hypothetical protein
MKIWAVDLGEDIIYYDNLELVMKSGSGTGTYLDNKTKRALKKLMYAVKLNASLKSLEQERNKICTQLFQVDRASKDRTEHIQNVQSKHAILQLENTGFEIEKQKLQQTVTN